jgi:4a-hydroxytetrahydrobiopterin dehydratase
MTETLAEKTCTPCRGGVPPLGRDEALRFQAQAPDWELRDEAHRIERTFRFRNFREALAFVQQVGELAESEGHHPIRGRPSRLPSSLARFSPARTRS